MIESDFSGCVGAEAIGSFYGQFDLVVQTLDHAARIGLPRLEIVQEKGTVVAQAAGDFLERIESAAHRPPAPGVEELPRPAGRHIGPEMLETLHKHEGSHSSQRG